MACKQTTLRTAAKALHNELSAYKWFVSVGMGTPNDEETLYVYVTSLKHNEIEDLHEYQGFPVVIEKTGRFKPAI